MRWPSIASTGAAAVLLALLSGTDVALASVQGNPPSGPATLQPDSGADVQQALGAIANSVGSGSAGGGSNVTANAQGVPSTFAPFNPPSIPLAVKGWYLNTWLPSGSLAASVPPNLLGNGGYLYQDPSFWTSNKAAPGDSRMGWNGYIRVNGATFQFLGGSFGVTAPPGANAQQISMTFTATRTTFQFQAASVKFSVSFMTPVRPDDLLRQSIPMSYLEVRVDRSTVGNRRVQVFVDIDEKWITGYYSSYGSTPYSSTWNGNNGGSSVSYYLQRRSPQPLTEYRQRAEWGSVAWAARKRLGLTARNQNAWLVHSEFYFTGNLTTDHPAVGGDTNSFGYAVDFNSAGGDSALFAVGHFRSPYVSYIKPNPTPGATPKYVTQERFGYWQTRFANAQQAVDFFLADYDAASAAAQQLDNKIAADAKAAVGGGAQGDQLAAISALSVRQAFATLEATVPKTGTNTYDANDVLIFLKEISSNGDCSTTDVIFPLFPLLSYLNPDLLRLVLEPMMQYQAAGLYPRKWAAHDLGTSPRCTGHPDGNEEVMQVEESGNMVAMVAHWAQIVGANAAKPYLQRYYPLLAQWTEFLISDSLIPAEQLSTDDFAGTLANQTNLALKGILGIGAMAQIAAAVGNTTGAAQYRATAEDYIRRWQGYAVSTTPSPHTNLAYQTPTSWGTLYNVYLNDLLNLNLVPQSVYDVGSTFLATKVAQFGLPLDSRHSWAKSDWMVWMSTAVAQPLRNRLLASLYGFYSNGRVDVPMTDLFETAAGDLPKAPFDAPIFFMARPVVGGHFAHQALRKAQAVNGVTAPRYPA